MIVNDISYQYSNSHDNRLNSIIPRIFLRLPRAGTRTSIAGRRTNLSKKRTMIWFDVRLDAMKSREKGKGKKEIDPSKFNLH